MTAQVLVQEYGNTTLNVEPDVDISVYKCPKISCTKFYFTQDDLDHHRILTHAEIPKHLTKIGIQNNGKFFNKNAMYRLNGKFQQENLKHTLQIINLDIQKIEKPIWKRIKAWWDGRRNRVQN